MGSLNHDEIIALLYKMIDQELEKASDQSDKYLIEACADIIEDLSQGNQSEILFSKAEIEIKLNNLLNYKENQNIEDTKILSDAKTSKKKSKSLFKLFIAAAIFIVVFLSITVIAKSTGYSSAWDLIKTNFIEIFNLEDKNKIDKEGISVIKNSAHKKYETLEELLREEQLNIFYPTVLPQELKIKSVIIHEIDENTFVVSFKVDSDNLSISVSNNYVNALKFQIKIQKTKHLNFYITPLGRLSTKCETDNHPLCGWVAKVIPKIPQTWYNKMSSLL